MRVEKDIPGFIVNRTQAPAGVLLNCYLDKKVAEPEEVVDAVLFLCTETAKYITGETIYVDGGTLANT